MPLQAQSHPLRNPLCCVSFRYLLLQLQRRSPNTRILHHTPHFARLDLHNTTLPPTSSTQPTEGKKHAKCSTFRFNFPSDYFFRRDESSRRKIPLQVILCGSTPVLWHSSHEGALFHTHCSFLGTTHHHPQPERTPDGCTDNFVPPKSRIPNFPLI